MSGVGGFLHERILLDPVEALLIDVGAKATRGYVVDCNGKTIDLARRERRIEGGDRS